MAAGAFWTVGLRFAVRLLGLVSLVVLARLLTPADFGLVALATLLAASIELLGSFNFEVWLIRHPAAGRDHYDTVWTLSVLRGAVTALLLTLVAQPAAAFFDEPRLAAVLMIIGVAAAVGALRNVGVIDFQKRLQFDKDFLLLVGGKLGGFCVTVATAWAWRSYWALVAGLVAQRLFDLALSYRLHPYRPRFSLRCWHEAFHFSKWLLASNLLNFIYNRADTFIFGKLLNSQTLGLYTVAREVADLAVTELVMPVRRVLLPGYAQMSGDAPTLRRGFVDSFAVIVLIGLPLAAGIGLTAEPLVRVLLGARWLEAVPLVQILAVYGIASVGFANQGPVLLALGHARLASLLLGLGVALLIPAVAWAGLRFGVQGGAWALGVVNVLLLATGLTATLRVLGVTFGQVLSQIWRSVAATALMAVAVSAVQLSLHGLPALLQLAACVAAGAVSYAAALLVLWWLSGRDPGPERALLGYLQNTVSK